MISCSRVTDPIVYNHPRRALDYRDVIYLFVAKTPEFRSYEITMEDWETIKMVCEWLRHFRDATTQMSATKQCTISSTHAVFRGLQDSLTENLRQLPPLAPMQLRKALQQAHEKLSTYIFKFNESPYPIWATRECTCLFTLQNTADTHQCLTPGLIIVELFKAIKKTQTFLVR
jgi:hypothetical protein